MRRSPRDGHVDPVHATLQFLARAHAATLDRVTLGLRPMPTDGFPIVGHVPDAPDLYIAVTHSGMTLAPYRPGRFSQNPPA